MLIANYANEDEKLLVDESLHLLINTLIHGFLIVIFCPKKIIKSIHYFLQVLDNLPHDLVYSENQVSPWKEVWVEKQHDK